MMPPVMPVIVPMITAMPTGALAFSAMWQPRTENPARPSASAIRTVHCESTSGPRRSAIGIVTNAVPAASAIGHQCRSHETGSDRRRSPSVPPPIAAMTPRTTTPKTSIRRRVAAIAPETANPIVPMASRTVTGDPVAGRTTMGRVRSTPSAQLG